MNVEVTEKMVEHVCGVLVCFLILGFFLALEYLDNRRKK